MKTKWLALFLMLLLLWGCAAPQEPEIPSSEPPVSPIADPEPTEPVGFYKPDSTLERATKGAVKAYPLDTDSADGIRFLGRDILLFSGHDNTCLTLLSGETCYVKARLQLSCPVSSNDPAVTVSHKGVTYVDFSSRTLVFLNEFLTEVSRIPLPEGCGNPVLSADRRMLYYCTADSLRVLDLETGIDRLLKEMSFPFQELTGLHCDDTVLQCSAIYDDGSEYTLFFSTETGALLYETMEDIPLWTEDDFYFATHMDGTYRELISGSGDFGPSVLVPKQEPQGIEPVPGLRSLLTYRQSADGSTTALDCYDLESGAHLAQIELPGSYHPVSTQPDPSGSVLWFLCFDDTTGQSVLCAWNLDHTPSDDAALYLQPRRNRKNPDLDGLAQCSLLAKQISVKHDVQILIWADATESQPWDYTLVEEYQVPLILDRLAQLDEILSCYPAGFLAEAASQTGNGILSICLVRSINGNPDTGALDSAVGLQFWDQDARAYLAVTPGYDMAQHIYHELFHIIDTRVLSSCDAYDNWNSLNPKSFSYDNGYHSGLQQDSQALITGENRYFIDLYSMSYPKEDRARIMEYAMQDGQQELFQAAPMQAKLRQLCLGIREAFGLKQEATVYRWEQYLQTPLAPTK